MTIIYQPQGTGTLHKEGTVLNKAPGGSRAAPAGSGWLGAYYINNDGNVAVPPTTGSINDKYDPRFDDPRYYTGDSAS